MEDKLSISVNVAERYYPLKIDRNDEEKIRKAAKLINEKVVQYKQRYNDNDKDNQDFLAMAALQFVIKLIESENKFEVAPVLDELSDLNEWLEDYLVKSNIRSLK
jgi:cell division protein ZapA (FtsZ GTPase activity inhibitor)